MGMSVGLGPRGRCESPTPRGRRHSKLDHDMKAPRGIAPDRRRDRLGVERLVVVGRGEGRRSLRWLEGRRYGFETLARSEAARDVRTSSQA